MELPATTSDLETWRLALAVGLLMVSAFCAHLLLLPGPYRRTRRPLGLFFLANAVRLLALPAEHLLLDRPIIALQVGLELIEVPLSMVQPFLLWLYVRRLTYDPTTTEAPVRRGRQLAPIAFAGVVYLLVLGQQAAFGRPELNAHALALQGVAVALLWAATVLFYALVLVYTVLTIRRLLVYKLRLKDLYASTEGREMRWIWGLTGAVAAFWTFNMLSILADALGGWRGLLTPATAFYLEAAAQIVLLWIIAIWGARQRPGIRRPPVPVRSSVAAPEEPRKYGHSGLGPAALSRIAAKIEAAITKQQLYRNPDLSLWDLAETIGAKRHAVSQALNEDLGRNFFDYVNQYRVAAAKAQLRASDDSILTITFDVGFNSRSVFYRAFRQEVGMTPSQYRRRGAAPEGREPLAEATDTPA